MGDHHYYNPRFLYAEIGPASEKQLIEVIIKAIQSTGLAADFSINIVKGNKGCFSSGDSEKHEDGNKKSREANYCNNQYGFAYIWINNPEVGYMISGLNPDGTELIREIPDPNWKAPSQPLDEALNELKSKEKTLEMDFSMDVDEYFLERPVSPCWSDEILPTAEELKQRYVQPMIVEKLSSPMELSPYTFTIHQKNLLEDMCVHECRLTDDVHRILRGTLRLHDLFDADPIHGYISVEPGYIKAPPSKYDKNTLYCKQIPDFVTASSIKAVFSNFVTNPSKTVIVKEDGKNVSVTYPVVNITKNKTGPSKCFIRFDKETVDACFAYAMTRKLTLTDPNTGREKTIVFSYGNAKN